MRYILLNKIPSISFEKINIDKRKRVDLKLSTIYIFTRDHTANSFKKTSLMTRGRLVTDNISLTRTI